jgi:tetratricopeptide (TPR) repeat protein
MDDLIQVALLAFRHGRYSDAVELLLQVVDAEPENWLAKLYLATAYGKDGRFSDSQRLFKRMSTDCPDAQLKAKALDGLRIVEEQMKAGVRKQPAKVRKDSTLEQRVVNWW